VGLFVWPLTVGFGDRRFTVGDEVGCPVGFVEVGREVGLEEGEFVGTPDGCDDGFREGWVVG